MQEWEKLLINDAFDKSPMLKASLISAYLNERNDLLSVAVDVLAIRSGMRESFIKQNIEEIITM